MYLLGCKSSKLTQSTLYMHPNYYFLNGQNLPRTQYFVVSKKIEVNKEEKEYKERGRPDLPTLGLGILLCSVIYHGKGQKGRVIFYWSQKKFPQLLSSDNVDLNHSRCEWLLFKSNSSTFFSCILIARWKENIFDILTCHVSSFSVSYWQG